MEPGRGEQPGRGVEPGRGEQPGRGVEPGRGEQPGRGVEPGRGDQGGPGLRGPGAEGGSKAWGPGWTQAQGPRGGLIEGECGRVMQVDAQKGGQKSILESIVGPRSASK